MTEQSIPATAILSEAIILAGGLGTRLRSAVPDLPKCMAPINGRPFMATIIDYYQKQGIQTFVFSLGYKHEIITAWLQATYPELNYRIALEEEPLGTGGAIRLAANLCSTNNVLTLNGDTFFKVDLQQLAAFNYNKKADCLLALKPMQNFDRYGVVDIDADNRVQAFKEKMKYERGLINGGVYVLNRNVFLQQDLPAKFSFEKDWLEKKLGSPIYGCVQDAYFIDIGIPEDFEKAQHEIPLHI